MFNCPVEQVERFQPTLTLCTNVHVVRVTLFELTCLKFRYKNLISWANRRTKAAQEKLDVHWVHPFPSFKRMHREWQRLGKAQKLETTIHNGKVGVRWDLPHFFNYVATQKELMESMDFPMIDGEQLFVTIIRGDGFPCGSRPWVQIAIGFANHMEKARTLQYNWTLDVALTSEHEDEAMRVLFCATLQHIQTIIDSGYIQMNNVYYRGRIMLGGDSPWLRLLFLKNIYPWGAGMFSGDIVESLNYILKDHFLCSGGRGGGPGGRVARDKRMLKQAHERIFLAKELPRWERTSAGGE